jgi:hypothetical protein
MVYRQGDGWIKGSKQGFIEGTGLGVSGNIAGANLRKYKGIGKQEYTEGLILRILLRSRLWTHLWNLS